MNKTPLSINFGRFQAYRLAPDEVALFEFLIFKQCHFDPYSHFYHSQRRLISDLKIKRSRLEKIINTFEGIGFLKTEVKEEGKTNNQVTYFMVDFDILEKDEVLSQIIEKESELYNDFKKWLKCVF
jgi:DNA-binding MarR family transcriptional regulator